MIKQTKLWWEITAWDKYLEHVIVPRGLQIKLIPAEHLCNNEFVVKWQNILTKCSIELMQLIKNTEESQLGEVNIEVDNYLNSTQEFKENEAYLNVTSKVRPSQIIHQKAI